MTTPKKITTAVLFLGWVFSGLFISCIKETDTDTWTNVYSETDNKISSVSAPIQLADGGYIFIEERNIVKLDSFGNVLFRNKLIYEDESDEQSINPITTNETSDGGILVSSYLYKPNTVQDDALLLLKLDNEGTALWQKLYYGSESFRNWSGTISTDMTTGNIYALGGTDNRHHLIKLDRDGTLLWSKFIDDEENLNFNGFVKAVPGDGCIVSHKSGSTLLFQVTRVTGDGSIL